MTGKAFKDAAKALGADALVKRLFDGRQVVRENAASALGEAGNDAKPHLHLLLLGLKDGTDSVRVATAGALARLKTDPSTTVPALMAALARPSDKLADAVLDALDAFGDSAIEPVIELLPNRNDWVLKTVGRVVPLRAATFLPPVKKVIESSDSLHARMNSIDIVGMMGSDAESMISALLPLLDHNEVLIRARTARALGRIANGSPAVEAAIGELYVKDANPTVQEACEEALAFLNG